jgi:sulfoxide reductase heme-binding subunit YedZ
MTAFAIGSGASPLWYATRATGVVALLLLTLTVLLGIAGAGRATAPGLPRVVTAGLHRNVSALVLCLVAVHVLTTVADSYVHIGLLSAVVPFTAPYRRPWLGLGAIALDLLLAVGVTSALRDRLPYRAWRAVHLLAYACWPAALWHGLGTGTDSGSPWLLALDAACLAAVAAAAAWRLAKARPGQARRAAAALTGPARTGSARNGSARTGSARTGSARNGSAPAGPALGRPALVRSPEPRAGTSSRAAGPGTGRPR